MKRLIRILVLVGVASVAVVGGYFLVGGGEEGATPAAGDPLAFPEPNSNRTCRECHPEIYAQWERSYHGLAWDDPQLQVPGMRLKENPDCWPCHIPAPIHLSKLGMLPQARAIRRSEGVGCIACHYTLKGMAGKVTDPSPPCRPVANEDMATMEICSGCHNQHKTHDSVPGATTSTRPTTSGAPPGSTRRRTATTATCRSSKASPRRGRGGRNTGLTPGPAATT
ncbi:MAG: multiheme c-type cytochrome [Planctomycetota bacterium]